jgi:hypothetical protein
MSTERSKTFLAGIVEGVEVIDRLEQVNREMAQVNLGHYMVTLHTCLHGCLGKKRELA